MKEILTDSRRDIDSMDVIDPENERIHQQLEAIKEISNSREAALAEYYKGDPEAASQRQASIDDLLEKSLEGKYPNGVYVAMETAEDGVDILRHPDEVTEPGHCTPNRVHQISDRVYFTDAFGRTRTLICESIDSAQQTLEDLKSRGFAQTGFSDRRNQIMVTDRMHDGSLVRIDTNEPSMGKHNLVKDAIYQSQDFPVVDQHGQVRASVKDRNGRSWEWSDPYAPWNMDLSS